MGLAIRSIRIGTSFDLCPKIICDICGSTIDAGRGRVAYKQWEPYAEELRFCHEGYPCWPKQLPPGWRWLALDAFMVHFTKRFGQPEIQKRVPLRLIEKEV